MKRGFLAVIGIVIVVLLGATINYKMKYDRISLTMEALKQDMGQIRTGQDLARVYIVYFPQPLTPPTKPILVQPVTKIDTSKKWYV